MIQTPSQTALTKQIFTLMTVHTVLLILYNYTFEIIDPTHLFTDYLPLILLFCIAPLAAAFLLRTQAARLGTVLLLGLLLAALCNIIITRFTSLGSFALPSSSPFGRILFELSFGGVLILEGIGFWLSIRLLRLIHKNIDAPHSM